MSRTRNTTTPAATQPAPEAVEAVSGTLAQAGELEVIAPELLVPKIDAAPETELFWFWVGCVHDTPFASIDVAGVSFPRETEMVQTFGATHSKAGKTERNTCRGDVTKLSREQLREIAKRLPMKVVRLRPEMENQDDEDRPLAILLNRSTEQEIADRKAGKLMKALYRPSMHDRPLANYLFLQWLDEPNPAPRGISTPCPRTISETGIVIPPPGATPVRPEARTYEAKL